MKKASLNGPRSTRSITSRTLLVVPLGLTLFGLGPRAVHAQTVTPAPSCVAALASLVSEWQEMGFAEPTKPSQMIVTGRNGRTTTAGQYNFMRQRIRVAARDCEAGREEDAMRDIYVARSTLEHREHFD